MSTWFFFYIADDRSSSQAVDALKSFFHDRNPEYISVHDLVSDIALKGELIFNNIYSYF